MLSGCHRPDVADLCMFAVSLSLRQLGTRSNDESGSHFDSSMLQLGRSFLGDPWFVSSWFPFTTKNGLPTPRRQTQIFAFQPALGLEVLVCDAVCAGQLSSLTSAERRVLRAAQSRSIRLHSVFLLFLFLLLSFSV